MRRTAFQVSDMEDLRLRRQALTAALTVVLSADEPSHHARRRDWNGRAPEGSRGGGANSTTRPTRLPRSEEFRRMFLAQKPGWTPDAPDVADGVRRKAIAERQRHSDSWAVVELGGADLPADSVRAKVRGGMTGRSVDVDSWDPEPYSTSAWAVPRVEGTDARAAEAIVETVPADGPLISTGISTTTNGLSAVMLEVDHLTPAISTWFHSQPPGSVQLNVFIDLTTRLAPAK